MGFDIVSWNKLENLNDDFNTWKHPWATERMQKIDKLDSVAGQAEMNDVTDTINAVENKINHKKVSVVNMAELKASSIQNGIQLIYETSIGSSYDGITITNTNADSAPVSVRTKGVMIRYSKTGFPQTIYDGTLIINDTDVVGRDTNTAELFIKRKIYTLDIALNFGEAIYISCFPYTEDNIYNESLTGKNCLKVVYNYVSFSTAPWEQINEISKNGSASSIFHIGDEKVITLTTGEKITLQIYGFNYDNLADGSGKAGITIGTKNLIEIGFILNEVKLFEDTELFKFLQTGFYDLLPLDLMPYIKKVTKLCGYLPGDEDYSCDRPVDMTLFIFDADELEGGYPIFTDNNSRIKCLEGSEEPNFWSIRNPAPYNPGYRYVRKNGEIMPYALGSETPVCFGFCI